MAARGEECRKFDNVSLCMERTGLQPAKLQLVLAIMSAESSGVEPPTRGQACRRAEINDATSIGDLVYSRWVEEAGKRATTRKSGGIYWEQTYRATARAWRELGFERPAGRRTA